MIFHRCKDQASKSLFNFYTEVANSTETVSSRIGKTMLGLITRLESHPDSRAIYGLTSHYRLCFLDADDYKGPWYVIVSALDDRNYYIEYLIPKASAPWPNAYVKGEAQSEEEAIRMILIALDNCDGWKN